MRILVRCGECSRKYDASRFKIGSRFRCHCGEPLTVHAPRGQEAQVIRCSSCGSPCDEGSKSCGHCGADFTIHERDLDTVCPQCMTRVSDRSKFCSHCGCSLSAEAAAGDDSEYGCPSCKNDGRLVSRLLGDAQINALECSVCVGLWVGIDCFAQLRDQVGRGSRGRHVRPPSLPQLKPESEKAGTGYRNCPACDKLMTRRSYGKGSGVVIDLCVKHGIWFDDGELRQVIEWLRLGGWPDNPVDAHFRANDKRAAIERNEQTNRALQAKPPIRARSSDGTLAPATSTATSSSRSDSGGYFDSALEALLWGFSDFFP